MIYNYNQKIVQCDTCGRFLTHDARSWNAIFRNYGEVEAKMEERSWEKNQDGTVGCAICSAKLERLRRRQNKYESYK